MKKLRNFILYALIFLGAFMFFTPKVQLYFALEKVLKPYQVILANEVVHDKGMSLQVHSMDLYVQGIESAHIESIDISLFGLYNKVDISNITLAKTFIKMVPTDINSADITYSVLNPLQIMINAEGDFGLATGYVNLVERVVHIDLEASKLLKTRYRRSLKQFKKSQTGGLVYEYHF